jgi:hypothetical protein
MASEADRHSDQQPLAERLVGDRHQRAPLGCRFAARSERELQGEDPNYAVHNPSGD